MFFEAPDVLRKSFPGGFLDMHLRPGRSRPRRNLDIVLGKAGQKREDWFNKLTPEDGALLRGGAQAKRLIALLESVMDYSSKLPAAG